MEHTHPLVSVVLATYNGERFLATQLDSLLAQTYPNIEIIAVDDGSTDRTSLILKDYACRHQHIQVYINSQNLGFIKNFEKGCTLAGGDFLALCDQDDYWHPQKIEKLVYAIGKAPMAYCDSVICNEELKDTGIRISDKAALQPIHSPLQQAVFCRLYGHASLFTRSVFEMARPFLCVIPHDWWLAYTATLNGGIKYIDEPLVSYRQHAFNSYGVVGGKRKKTEKVEDRRVKRQKEIAAIRTRINAFYMACPKQLSYEKKVLQELAKSYNSFSLANNISRVLLFLRYRRQLLAVKKQSALQKFLFCLKMFVMLK